MGNITTLDEAIRQAKIDAGLDPELKYQAALFCDYLPMNWRKAFWILVIKEINLELDALDG